MGSTTGQSITLANCIIGVGILAMPFCFQKCGVLLATLILLSMGLVSRLCCYFLLKSAIITRRRSYEFLAFHIFGPGGKIAVEMGIIGFLMGTCIAYFVVVGDLGPQIIAKMFNINQSDILRTSVMVVVSLVCVLPLGLLKNVDSLSNVSAATIAFYFCLVIKVITEATGQLFTEDWMSRIELWKPSGVLQCVPIFSMALFCQTQLFEIFDSMPSLSLEKSCLVTKNAINICAGVYCTLGIFGYIAFGSQEISGNVLMSLSPTMTSDVIKLGFVMSLAFSFPLVIFPCRASLYSFLYRRAAPSHEHGPSAMSRRAHRALTVSIVAAALGVSLLLPAVELALGLAGATAGVLVCVLLPAAARLALAAPRSADSLLAKFVIVLGLIILVLGTYANLRAAETSLDKYDERQITRERIDKMVEEFFQKMERSDSEGVMAKPQLQNNHIPESISKLGDQVIKDSEVQPPNPIPPESQSNEKPHVPNQIPIESKIVQNVAPEIKNGLDKFQSTHPKNVQLKLNEVNDIKNNNIIDVVEKDVEKPTKEDKPQSNQDKIDMMKQQQLVETIKQHGKEQKELIKEQKEILDEIIKTKKELEKNKQELDSNEAKKIAVESIQKIAKVAIQSLSGVTNKPEAVKINIEEKPVEKSSNIAVNEIAKKTAETLDAIKKINEETNKIDKIETPVGINQNVNEKSTNEMDKLKILESNSPKQNNVLSETNKMPENVKEQKNVKQDIPQSDNAKNNLENFKPKSNDNLNNGNENDNKQSDKIVEPKQHSHLPDEPQSYKQGEDAQKNADKPKIQNMPLPIVMNENIKLNKNTIENQNNGQSARNDGALIHKDNILNNIANGNIINPRRKREIVDCTEKTTLKPEDRQICENLLNESDHVPQEVFLKKVNLGDDVLANSLQAVAYHVRSLKSIHDDKKR